MCIRDRLYLKLVEFMMLFHRAQKQGGVQPGRPDAPRDQLVQDALRYIHKLYSPVSYTHLDVYKRQPPERYTPSPPVRS